MPTLVVHGTADRLIRPENGELIARLIPAPIERLEGVGHMFWWEQPQRSAELIREHALPRSRASELSSPSFGLQARRVEPAVDPEDVVGLRLDRRLFDQHLDRRDRP